MNRKRGLILAVGMMLSSGWLSAHETGLVDSDHEGSVPESIRHDSAAKPHIQADGRLYVPKRIQHVLGLRTQVFESGDLDSPTTFAGEVIADPNSAGRVTALQSGQLEVPAQGWPLPGKKIKSGELLAILHPLLTQQEQARRRAELAQIDEDMQIAEINEARLKLQAEANGSGTNAGNVYYEQARLEWEGLKEKYRLGSEALSSRVEIRSPVDGLLLTVAVQPGEIVKEGQPLFELSDPAHLRVALTSFEGTLASRVRSARLENKDSGEVLLALRGQEPLPQQQGWRLLFDIKSPLQTSLTAGQLVNVVLQRSDSRPADRLGAACLTDADGHASAWIHVAPEQFERRTLSSCQQTRQEGAAAASNIAAGDRVVTQGAALLSEYR